MSRSRLAASFLALLTAVSIWLSAGIVLDGVSERIAALPSLLILAILAVTLPVASRLARLRLEHAWPLAISLILWLPFLGWSSLWEGPIEGIVWLLVVAGLIAARPPKLPTAFANPAVAPVIAGLILALASAVVFGQVRNVIPGGDEPHYLAATQSLLHDADLKVENNYAKGEYLEYFPGRLEPHFLKRSTGGEIYSIHAPGVSAIVLPAFAVAGYTGAVWTMILVAAITAALMWRLAFTVSGSPAGAWMGVTGVCFSAPYFFHTFTIYPEIIGGLCVLAGVWLLVELSQGRDPSDRVLIAVGVLLAILPWLHSRFAVPAAIIGLLLSARLANVRRIAVLLAVPAIVAAGWFGFFYVIWGSPSPTAPYGPETSTSVAYVPRGVIGLLFDQQFGVFTTAPIYVIALVGGVALLRAQPRLAIELALIVIPYALTAASYAMWWGGAAAPGRFLVAILPLAALPIATVWSGSKTLRTAALILAVVSAALILPRAFVESGRFIYNNRSGLDATLEWLSPIVDLPSGLPSVHRHGGTAAFRDGAGWFVLFGVALLVGWSASKRSRAVMWTAATLAFAGVVTVGTRGAAVTIDRSKLAALAELRAWHVVFVDISAGRAMTQADFLSALAVDVSQPTMRINRLPAAEYRLAQSEPWHLMVGRNDQPIVFARDRLRLPVMLQSATIATSGGRITPVALIAPVVHQQATHAARFREARAFFFDEKAYPEKDGFWTRANGSATVVIDTDEGNRLSGLPIAVTAGAVATTVRLSMGNWVESFSLAAGQKQDVMLPPAVDGAWRLRIRSGAGFRPSERDPGSSDVRMLAAWIAISP